MKWAFHRFSLYQPFLIAMCRVYESDVRSINKISSTHYTWIVCVYQNMSLSFQLPTNSSHFFDWQCKWRKTFIYFFFFEQSEYLESRLNKLSSKEIRKWNTRIHDLLHWKLKWFIDSLWLDTCHPLISMSRLAFTELKFIHMESLINWKVTVSVHSLLLKDKFLRNESHSLLPQK